MQLISCFAFRSRGQNKSLSPQKTTVFQKTIVFRKSTVFWKSDQKVTYDRTRESMLGSQAQGTKMVWFRRWAGKLFGTLYFSVSAENWDSRRASRARACKKNSDQKNQNLFQKSYQEWCELFQASWKFYFMKWFSLHKLFYSQKPWFLIGFFIYFAKWARKVWKNSKIQMLKTFPWKTSLQLTPPATVCSNSF